MGLVGMGYEVGGNLGAGRSGVGVRRDLGACRICVRA